MASIKSIVKSKTVLICSVLIYFVIFMILILLSWNLIEPRAYNFMVKNYTATSLKDDSTVLVVIDDKSVARHRWPWKRELYGEIFSYLNTYGNPKSIAFDAILAAPDPENPASDLKLYNSIKNIDNLTVGFMPLDSTATQNFGNKDFMQAFAKKFSVNVKDNRINKIPSGFSSVMQMPKKYFSSVSHSGSVFTYIEPSDFYLKRSVQLLDVNGHFYPSLALAMYLMNNNADTITLNDDSIVIDKTGLTIPGINTQLGFMNYTKFYKIDYGEYSHKKYSAIDIIDSYHALKQGKKPLINPEEFKGKTVFVGANATATGIGLADKKDTPVLDEHPGVDYQAVNYDNLKNKEFVEMSSGNEDRLFVLLCGVITFALIYSFPFIVSLIIIVGLCLLYYYLTVLAYKHNIAISVITPFLVVLWTMVFAYSYRFIIEGKNKEKIKNAMGRYLSQDIMKNVVKNIDDIKLGGKKANVTVLFADIRGFTSMSEKMSAEEVSMILNEYFTALEPIIAKYNGVINKFIGDAVMAIFGEPIQDINHPENAVRCAYEMLEKVAELREKWLAEGKPKIEIGIGINTGEAFVGNIGSEKRLEYTVIGDMVNLASRIESYNKVYKSNFLISASTYEVVSAMVEVVKISDVQIRGKAKLMDIYEVLKVLD
ncbi:MAG: adenylate/guanylate cyclase domain-containing protein [Clostridiaceae bacterium]|nr:adenylate/guanylate cyclase domain-containing protein [Clostridiaceae bacterium]